MIHLGLTPAEIGRLTPRMLSVLWIKHEEREQNFDGRFACLAQLSRDGKSLTIREALQVVTSIRREAPGALKPRKRITTPEEAVLLYQRSSEESLSEMLTFTAVHNANLKQRGKA